MKTPSSNCTCFQNNPSYQLCQFASKFEFVFVREQKTTFKLFKMTIDFFSDLHKNYCETASKWALDSSGQNFEVQHELLENIDLIGVMEMDVASKKREVDILKHDLAQKETAAENIRRMESDKKAELAELEGLATELQNTESDFMKRIEILQSKRREKQVCLDN